LRSEAMVHIEIPANPEQCVVGSLESKGRHARSTRPALRHHPLHHQEERLARRESTMSPPTLHWAPPFAPSHPSPTCPPLSQSDAKLASPLRIGAEHHPAEKVWVVARPPYRHLLGHRAVAAGSRRGFLQRSTPGCQSRARRRGEGHRGDHRGVGGMRRGSTRASSVHASREQIHPRCTHVHDTPRTKL